MARARETSR